MEANKGRRPYRVLLIAEAANPEWTSVPLIGWKLSRALAEIADVHLVTQIRNQGAILRAGLIEGRDFTVIDNEDVALPLVRISSKLRGGAGKGWTTTMAFSSLAYYSFERKLWRLFQTRISAHEFDLVHRITPVSPTSQSIIAKRLAKLSVPFVVGPLNGGVPWPRNFIDRQHAERDWLSDFRWIYKLMPGYQSMRKHSAAIIAGSRHTLEEMPRWAKNKCVYIPENGVDRVCPEAAARRPRTAPLRGAFVGRLVPYKGADLLIESATEYLRNGQLELDIIGRGPQRSLLETMVKELDVERYVRFHGWIPHAKVPDILGSCDFMALPSVREFGGGVVVESMALGVTPIVADYAGPSELVDETTGIRVPFRDKKSLVQGMTSAIGNVIRAPDILNRLGAAARCKVADKLTWEAKALQIYRVYEAVLAGNKDLTFLGYK